MKVLVITAMWPTAENPAFGSFVAAQVKHLEQEGIDIEVLVLAGRLRKLIYPKGVFELQRRLRGRKIDLIHAHFGYVGWVARTQWKLPVIVTFHGDDALGTINARGSTTMFSRTTAAICRRLGPITSAIIVQSDQMKCRFRCRNVHVIPHEVDLDVFRPTDRTAARHALGLAEDKKYVLFAADPKIPVKRFPLARKVVDELRIHDPSIELLIACREPQPRLALYMSACDALVFPSFQEGSPNVVKQAMACNLPIVATDVGDVRGIISGTVGCHIASPTVDDFTTKLGEILRTPLRTAGREHVQHFAGPVIARRVIRVYEDTLLRRATVTGLRHDLIG
jgi:glycosyltransferase involved in cell wall biosynthesis